MITSKTNQYIKLYGELQKKKYRHEYGLFPAEGKRLIEDLMENGLIPHVILYSETFTDIAFLEKNCIKSDQCFMVADSIFKNLTDTQNPQGIVGAFPVMCPKFADFTPKAPSLILVLNAVQDPGNLGAIIRNSAAAGISALILEDGTVDLYNPKVIRATMGAIAKIPIFYDLDFKEIYQGLKSKKIEIFLSDMAGDYPYWEIPINMPLAVVLGNEGNGISANWHEKKLGKIYIPQANGVESLNVAMVGGIIAFDFRRRCLN
ncbi:MAG: RNA methyltransferase [Clostridiales bacterium]